MLTFDAKEGDSFRVYDLKAHVVKRFKDRNREFVVYKQWFPSKRRWHYGVEQLSFLIQLSMVSK